MIISAGRSYIFVHIPKTGGTSLATALEQRAMKDDILIGDTPKAVKRRNRVKQMTARGRVWKHSTLSDIDGVMPAEQMRAMFAFTLVRNPWDRAVSYYHWLRIQNFDHQAVQLAHALEFEPFLLHPFIMRSFQQSPVRMYMTRADGVEQCQCVIRLEHFEQDAAPLFDHLRFRLDLPHLNRSERHGDYRRYYTQISRDAVAQICAEDIERFGYRF